MKFKGKDATPSRGLKSAVEAWIFAKAYADTLAAIDHEMSVRFLSESEYLYDYSRPWMKEGTEGERITDPSHAWRMGDEDYHEYLSSKRQEYESMGFAVEQCGANYWDYKCPNLVAKGHLSRCAGLVVYCAADSLGENPEDFGTRLLQLGGVAKFDEFVDLSVSWVMTSPGFKAPLIDSLLEQFDREVKGEKADAALYPEVEA